MMYEPEVLYDAHRAATLTFTGDRLPPWSALGWLERDMWQERADELNEARRGLPENER